MANKTFDNNLKLSLWSNESENSSAPIYKGNVTIDGVKWDVSLWENASENESAPVLKGNLQVPYKKGE